MCGLGGGSLVGGRRQADQQHELLGPGVGHAVVYPGRHPDCEAGAAFPGFLSYHKLSWGGLEAPGPGGLLGRWLVGWLVAG